jgi:hypothetical protein
VFHLSRRGIMLLLLIMTIAAAASFAQKASAKDSPWAITIRKKDVTSSARFYPYSLEGLAMEVLAVRASDGSIRTALNTCQVCYDSGRGTTSNPGASWCARTAATAFTSTRSSESRVGAIPCPSPPS